MICAQMCRHACMCIQHMQTHAHTRKHADWVILMFMPHVPSSDIRPQYCAWWTHLSGPRWWKISRAHRKEIARDTNNDLDVSIIVIFFRHFSLLWVGFTQCTGTRLYAYICTYVELYICSHLSLQHATSYPNPHPQKKKRQKETYEHGGGSRGSNKGDLST